MESAQPVWSGGPGAAQSAREGEDRGAETRGGLAGRVAKA